MALSRRWIAASGIGLIGALGCCLCRKEKPVGPDVPIPAETSPIGELRSASGHVVRVVAVTSGTHHAEVQSGWGPTELGDLPGGGRAAYTSAETTFLAQLDGVAPAPGGRKQPAGCAVGGAVNRPSFEEARRDVARGTLEHCWSDGGERLALRVTIPDEHQRVWHVIRFEPEVVYGLVFASGAMSCQDALAKDDPRDIGWTRSAPITPEP